MSFPLETNSVFNATSSYTDGIEQVDNYHNITAEYNELIRHAHQLYNNGFYRKALIACDKINALGTYRTDNLLLLGAVHFQLRNFNECIYYNQQLIRIDPFFAEAFGNLGNALKELGDLTGAISFYLKAIKLKPRFCDAYNNLACAYMQLGRIQEAIETFKIAIILNPLLSDAHCNLGNLYKTKGQFNEAKRYYCEAIRIRPNFAIAWSNLAGILKEEGDIKTSISYYREAIRLAPDFADAHSNLGNVLKETGFVKDAITCYEKAILIRPDFAIALANLASCYADEGRVDLAIRSFRHAIQLEPIFPDAYNNLGNLLREMGNVDGSIRCYRTALDMKPDHAHVYNNLGNALKDKGMIKEAMNCYMTAARIMPNLAAAHSNIGSVFKDQGKINQAIAHYQEAIKINPNFADVFSNMGNALKDLNRVDDAIKCYIHAIRLKPGFSDAYSNLASAYKDLGNVEEAIKCYRKALDLRPDYPECFSNYVHSLVTICDWNNRADDFQQLFNIIDKQLSTSNQLPCIQPFHGLIYPLSMKQFQAICERYANRAKLNVSLLDMKPFTFPLKDVKERLRIGYVSSDFGNHPLAHLTQSIFGMHNKKKYEIFCYALNPSDKSQWRLRISKDVEHFIDISDIANGEAAKLIHSHGIHILVNLNGYTKGARNEIFALRPAPLQMSYMGFCGTLGADYIQYMIGDEIVVPADYRSYFTEKIICMPHSYFVNDHKQSARDVLDLKKCPTRLSYGIPENTFVFCNFNQVYKIDPLTFSTWMNILRRVPKSILWLLRFPASAEVNIKTEAKRLGIDSHRIFFTDVAPKDEHLKRGYLGDLFLDTPECNAHTTGCDILWAGTPMITMAKQHMASRVASSLLTAADLPEMITYSLEEYEELAVALALDPDRLLKKRKHLEESRHKCPLFDTPRWVKNLELGYTLAWEKKEKGEDPDHIFVPDTET